MHARRNADAVSLLQSHVAQFPADLDADYLLGNAAYRAGDDDLARAAFGRCVRADPRHAGAHYGLGLTSLRHHQYEAARRAFVAALDANPRLERAREHLAKLPDGTQSDTDSQGDTDSESSGAAADELAAEDDEERPPYATTLKGRVVVGRVQDVQLRTDQKNRPLLAYSPKLETQNVMVLAFKLRGRDDRLVAVELRGLYINGSHPREGERVAVPERFEDGALRVRCFQNLETGEIVEAQDASALAKGLFGARLIAMVVAVVVAMAFIALVASRVLPGALEHL
jgi:tetratricopeptide (TPR) repeat protein